MSAFISHSTYPPPDDADIFRVGYLPGLAADELEWETREFSAHGRRAQLAYPQLTSEQLTAVARSVKAGAQAHLSRMPVMEIVDVIDRCVMRMLDAGHPHRQAMDALLPVITGFDPEMTRLGLNASLKAFRRPQLLRILVEDFGDPGLLDDFRPRARGGWTRACGPALLAHVWAGNVPGLPLWSMVAGLLVKGGSLGKVATAEPIFATWFAQTLAEVEPRLAESLAVAWWPGGDHEMEEALCKEADVFQIYGGDATLAAWQNRIPAGKRLLPHGHKLSLGLVSRSTLDTRQAHFVARKAALDIVRWDQQACFSPQVFYVERGGQTSPADFARHLAGELAALQHSFPRRSLSLEESAMLAQWRHRMEMSQLRGESLEILGSKDAPWMLAYLDEARAPGPGPLNRAACVMAVDHLADVLPFLESRRAYLQTIGLAASPEILFDLAPQLAQSGAVRICALGDMTSPSEGWHHDGRFSLLDMVRMVDIDASAEEAAESFAAYRD